MSTTADAIAARYGNDGRAWLDADGVELEECLVSLGARCEWRDGHGTDVRRYTLADGSAILLAGDCWDVGYSDCWCSATAIAHDERCEANEPSPWSWWEESDRPEAEVGPVTLDGWEVEETGGGMYVLSRLFGKYWAWMSDAEDGGRLPEVGSPALVCFYAPGDMGEPLAYATFATAAECAAWAEGYAARVVSADV